MYRYVGVYACIKLQVSGTFLMNTPSALHAVPARYSVLAGHALGTHRALGTPERYSYGTLLSQSTNAAVGTTAVLLHGVLRPTVLPRRCAQGGGGGGGGAAHRCLCTAAVR